MVSTYASTSAISSTVDGDVGTLRAFVEGGLDGFDPAAPSPAAVARVSAALRTLLAKGGIAHAEFRTPDGRVIASSDAAQQGASRSLSPDFRAALQGSPTVAVVDAGAAEAADGAVCPTP